MPKSIASMVITCILLATIPCAVLADKQKPRWELGAGLSVFDVPHYLGSEQSRTHVFPFPYVI